MSNQIQMCKVATYQSISKLKFYPDNPRTIRPERLEALKKSITKKGFYQPILVWKKGGIVLAGNHRLVAAQELIAEGWEFISPDGKKNVLPIVVEDVDDNMARAMLYETNNSFAEWVEDRLRKALQEAEEQGQSALDMGFSQDAVDKLLKDAIDDAESIADDAGLDDGEPGSGERKERIVDHSEPLEALMIPKSIYEEFTLILREISLGLSPEWSEGDTYAFAVKALCQAIQDKDIVEYIGEQASVGDDDGPSD